MDQPELERVPERSDGEQDQQPPEDQVHGDLHRAFSQARSVLRHLHQRQAHRELAPQIDEDFEQENRQGKDPTFIDKCAAQG